MVDFLKDLSDWVLDFADSDWAAPALAINSFFESIFFPVPPDPLLIGISIRQPEAALWLAALTTVSSVAGAVGGHWLGRRFGRPLLYRLVAEHRVAAVERMVKRHGAWAVLVAAFTPIPYKVFAISAGVMDLNMRTFITASLIGRGARFFILGGLLFFYGESVEKFIDENFDIITIGASVALVVGLGVLLFFARRRRARNVVGRARRL